MGLLCDCENCGYSFSALISTVMERGIIKVLLDVYLKLMQRLLVYSLNVCFILLNRLVDNILGISLLQDREKLRDKTNYEEKNSNWVRI